MSPSLTDTLPAELCPFFSRNGAGAAADERTAGEKPAARKLLVCTPTSKPL